LFYFSRRHAATKTSGVAFWVGNMVLIQILDLAAGAAYVLTGGVPLSAAAFPMSNAAIFALLVWFFNRPRPLAVQT